MSTSPGRTSCAGPGWYEPPERGPRAHPALDPRPWTACPCPALLAAKPLGWPPLQALVEWGRLALRVGLPWARGTAGWHSGWGPRGHLRAFVLGSQLQTIVAHRHLLTVHDFEQEGSEELDTVILKALVKGEAGPRLPGPRGRRWAGRAAGQPGEGSPHPGLSASRSLRPGWRPSAAMLRVPA